MKYHAVDFIPNTSVTVVLYPLYLNLILDHISRSKLNPHFHVVFSGAEFFVLRFQHKIDPKPKHSLV